MSLEGPPQRCSRGFESASGRLKTQVGGSPRAPKKRSTPPENSSWEVSNANFFSLRDKTQVGGFKPARAPARIAQSLAQAPSSRHPSCTRSPRAVRPQRKCTHAKKLTLCSLAFRSSTSRARAPAPFVTALRWPSAIQRLTNAMTSSWWKPESLRTPHPVFLNSTIRRLKLSAGTGG